MGSGMECFKLALYLSLFSPVVRLEVVGSLVLLRYTVNKEQACIINIYFGNLMRVAAMKIKMGLILFIELYRTYDGSHFT